jgi:hypothetical protein
MTELQYEYARLLNRGWSHGRAVAELARRMSVDFGTVQRSLYRAGALDERERVRSERAA